MNLRRGAALLLAALCLLLCACGGAEDSAGQDSVSVWCLEDEPLRPALEAWIRAYNKDPEGLPVSLRCFPDEESLAAAFDAARPDLLLCSHDRAWTLERQGLLRDVRGGLGAVPDYPAWLSCLSDCLGRSYFPLGVEVTLLAWREDAPAPGRGWAAFWAGAADYSAESGMPYFSAEEYGSLFYQALLQRRVEFRADLSRDGENEDFRELYNALAGGMFDGSIALTGQPVTLLLQGGELPCIAASSASLAALPGEGFAFSPLPGTDAGEPLPGMALGLAVTARDGRGTRSATAFLRWLLEEGRAGQAALDAGLIPVMEGELQAETALERELLRLQAEQDVHLYEPGGDYLRNRRDFELVLRTMINGFL